MGLFSKISGHIKELNKMSFAVGNTILLLDKYDQTGDKSLLPLAGWVCREGIQSIMESGNMLPTYSINICIDGRLQKMSVMDAYMKSVGRYSMIAGELSDQDKDDLLDILHGGDNFREVDNYLSQEEKKKLLNGNVSLR